MVKVAETDLSFAYRSACRFINERLAFMRSHPEKAAVVHHFSTFSSYIMSQTF